MDCAVGIVTYERPRHLGRALDSLLAGTVAPEELVVVDDSPDPVGRDAVETRRSAFEDRGAAVEYRHRPDGESMQTARNAIVDGCESDVVCFLDDDVVCPEGWLSAVREGYRQYDVVGVGGPAIKTDGDLEPVEPPIREQGPLNDCNDYGEVVDASGRWIPPDPVECPVFRGANMSFERDLLERIGGFDGDYGGPEIYEEWDVMFRIRERGGSLLYHPGARVHHVETEEGGSRANVDEARPGSYWFARNGVQFRAKRTGSAFRRSLVRLFLSGTDDNLPTVARRVGRLLARRDPDQLPWIRGYLEGVRRYG